ncbi:MAG: CehA/McbA family metallohydrolase [Acidimicrobiia bacterium]
MDLSRRRFLQVAAGVGAVATVPGFRSVARAAQGVPPGVWVAGDFHCHSVWSHDVWGGPSDDNTGNDEFYTHGHTPAEQIAVAETRGLDFLAITDHNRVKSVRDPGYRSDRLLLVPGYEHSLSGGHAGVFVPTAGGLETLFASTSPADGSGHGYEGAALAQFIETIAAHDGIAVLNHPFGNGSRQGMHWRYSLEHSHGFTAVEAWNSPWFNRGEILPRVESDSDLAVQWWEQHFARHRGLVGGSDNHWKVLDPVAGVGQPTTWVYARNRSVAAVLDGVREGRTFVAAQPPALGGSQAFLTAAALGDAPEMVGGKVSAGVPLSVRVATRNAVGSVVRIIASGLVVGEARVLAPEDEVVFEGIVLAKHSTLRAEVYDHEGLAMQVVTSAIRAEGQGAGLAPTPGVPVSYGVLGQPSIATPQAAAAIAAARQLGVPACDCSH